MPPLSIWMIRSALLHFVASWLVGALILWQKGPGGLPYAYNWLVPHLYMALVGWMVQLALGVAYWIMPRFARPTTPQGDFVQARGREGVAVVGAVLLNLSTLVVWFAGGNAVAYAATVALLGVIAFAIHLWARVKPFRTE